MNLQQLKLLELLADARIVSGEQLGITLGISRNAVWKHLQQLRKLGLEIESVSGRGYQLQTPLELLDKALILDALDQQSIKLPGELILQTQTGSTNDDLNKLSSAQQHGSVILAEYQSAGRGRRGRSWVSPFGHNIYLSMGWQFEHGVSQLAGLSLLAGLCIIRALHTFALNDVGLKWPNDVLRRKGSAYAKLGGCLIEINGDVTGPCQATIGLGLNLKLPDQVEIDQSWTDLSDHSEISRNALVAEIISQLLKVLPVFSTQGLGPFVEEWNQYHAYAGETVSLSGPQLEITGTAIGINPQGAILLQNKGEIETIHSGEISLRKK